MSKDGEGGKFVKAWDGSNLYYDEAGQGDDTLLFIHGWLCSSQDWSNQLRLLCETHRVVALDLGGHGRSAAQNRQDWSFEALARDVKSVADALGLDEVVLVGHSMGGAIALEAEQLMPGRVRGVIGVESFTHPEFYDRAPSDVTAALIATFRADLPFQVKAAVTKYRIAGENLPEIDFAIDRMANADPTMACATLQSFLQWDVVEALSHCGVPVCCISAEAFMSPEQEELWIGRVKLQKMKGVGHFPMLEAPAAFQTALLRSLDELQDS